MSQYVENHLGRNETIVLKAEKNILYLLMPFLWMVLMVVGAAVAQYFLNDLSNSVQREPTFDEFLADPGAMVDQGTRELAEAVYLPLTIIVWVAFGLIGVLPFVKSLLTFLSLNLALTNKRVVGKFGILSIVAIDITIDKIDHVALSASAFGNLFKYYSLSVVSVGGAGGDLSGSHRRKRGSSFVAIKNAQEFKDAVALAVEQHAEEARVAQAEAIARAMGGNAAH